MGSVYLGQDVSLQRLVAVKVLNEGLQDDGVRERFTREAHYAGRLRHRNIITIFGFGDDHGRPYIVMEYLPGETLADLIARRAPMSNFAKLGLMRDVCAGLSHAHRMGILHRDIKPANVMVDVDGTAKIVDFGIARRAESELTRTGTVVGTLNYLSPEQLRGEAIDARSDIFAVGALFYELMSGTRAFPGGIDDGVLARIMMSEPPPLRSVCRDVPPGVADCIARALAKSPDDRFADLEAMSTEIARLQEGVEGDRRQRHGEELARLVIAKPVDMVAVGFDTVAAQVAGADEQTGRAIEHVAAAERALKARRFEEAIKRGEQALALNAAAADAVTVLEQARAALREAGAASTVVSPPVPPRRRLRVLLTVAGSVLAIVLVMVGWNWYGSRTTGPGDPPTGQPTGSPTPVPSPTISSGPETTAVPTPTPLPPGTNVESLLAQARSMYSSGQREQALGVVQSVLLLDDKNATAGSLVQTWLTSARESVRRAKAAADAIGAAATATSEYQNGLVGERDAQRLVNSRPTESIRLLWVTTSSYNSATALGQQRASPTPVPTPSPTSTPPPPTPSASPPPVPTNSPTPSPSATVTPTATPTATSPPAPTSTTGGATPSPPAVPTASPTPAPAAIPPGARDALNRYAAAYAKQNLRDIKAVFPALQKDREDVLKKAFGGGCRAYEVRFIRTDLARVEGSSVFVLTDTEYTCTPATGGAKQRVTARDLFELKQGSNGWFIAAMSLM